MQVATKSTRQTCIVGKSLFLFKFVSRNLVSLPGLRNANKIALNATRTFTRCWGPLKLAGKPHIRKKKSARFVCKLRGSLMTGIPESQVGDISSGQVSRQVSFEDPSFSRPNSILRSIKESPSVSENLGSSELNTEVVTLVCEGWLEVLRGRRFQKYWARLLSHRTFVHIEFKMLQSSEESEFVLEVDAKNPKCVISSDAKRETVFALELSNKIETMRADSFDGSKKWQADIRKTIDALFDNIRQDSFRHSVQTEQSGVDLGTQFSGSNRSGNLELKTPSSTKSKGSKGGFFSTLFGTRKLQILDPIDLIGCQVRPSLDPNKPTEIEVLWWGNEKEVLKIRSDGYVDAQMWQRHIRLASGLANVEKQVSGTQWNIFNPDITFQDDQENSTNKLTSV
mmetsp:Transcript_18208/g.25272  ORF Transcript_18208/g.25272 Transcript_18208/m.25272 type:complete len:396 (+) Transcript_18208:3560-4747(+)